MKGTKREENLVKHSQLLTSHSRAHMASSSSSSTYSAYPAHPQHGGKGLPPPQPAQTNGIIGNPPDLLKRFKLKAKYLKIQKKYFQSIEVRAPHSTKFTLGRGGALISSTPLSFLFGTG